MAKLTSLEASYKMNRQLCGSYTNDEIAFRVVVSYSEDENPDLIVECKNISGKLKEACHRRLNDAILKTELQKKNNDVG